MGYLFLSPPGTEFGPCKGTCEHTDCKATRDQAAGICPFCGGPIGYEHNFYSMTREWIEDYKGRRPIISLEDTAVARMGPGILVHTLCVS